ncbi:hypothetical protein L9F63_006968, partial [Diploptera punctata]
FINHYMRMFKGFHCPAQEHPCTIPPEKRNVVSCIADHPGTFTYDGNILYCRVSA